MKAELSPALREFESTVAAFTRTHWRGDVARPEGLLAELDGGPWTAAQRQWLMELAHAGWSVPHWPTASGGRGWSNAELFLFSRVLTAAGAPVPFNMATVVAGPLLLQERLTPEIGVWLDSIRTWQTRWSVAVAEPEGVAHAATSKTASGYRLSGTKTWVTGGLYADWILCRAEAHDGGAWFVVRATAPGVQREALPVMGAASALARVQFESVELTASARLQTPPDVRLPDPPLRVRSPAIDRVISAVRGIATHDDDAALRVEADRIEVGVRALEALEYRLAFGVSTGGNAARAGLATLLALRGAELGQAASALRARALGYDALPFPDAGRFHNEGVFGDEMALPAVRQALFDRAFTLYATGLPGQAASIEALKDELAREVLGFEHGASTA